MKKRLIALILATVTTLGTIGLSPSIKAKADTAMGWQRDGKYWTYDWCDGILADDWMEIDGNWYFFNKKCHMQTGWVFDKGHRYYLGNDGIRKTGWQLVNSSWYYLNNEGVMVTGIQLIEGINYKFNSNGVYLGKVNNAGWIKEGSNWLFKNEDGSLKKGWFNDNGTFYFFNNDGIMQTGWLKDNDLWYFLKNNGVMATGWLKNDGHSYYLNPNGSMKTGWMKEDGDWYYLMPTGEKTTRETKINGVINRFLYDGRWIGEFNQSKNGWFLERNNGFNEDHWYFYENGEKKSGWLTENGNKYYFHPSGIMAIGWASEGDNSYYFDKSGKMKTGWVKDEGNWYFLNEDGSRVNKYKYINGVKNNFSEYGVWLGEDKRTEKGWIYIKGESEYTSFWNYIDNNGKPLENQWLSYDGSWYRFDKNGKMLQNTFFREGNNEYYLDPKGKMVTGWVNYLYGLWHYFNESGVMQKGWVSYGGKWYYMYNDGTMLTSPIYEIDDKLQAFNKDGVWIGEVGDKTTVYQMDKYSKAFHFDPNCMKHFYERWSSPKFNNINNPIKLTFNEAKAKGMKGCAWCHRGDKNTNELIYPFDENLK